MIALFLASLTLQEADPPETFAVDEWVRVASFRMSPEIKPMVDRYQDCTNQALVGKSMMPGEAEANTRNALARCEDLRHEQMRLAADAIVMNDGESQEEALVRAHEPFVALYEGHIRVAKDTDENGPPPIPKHVLDQINEQRRADGLPPISEDAPVIVANADTPERDDDDGSEGEAE